ncbi:MAG: TerB family tellurite resistance protein [Candidatus Muiribacteriota bacterium]
MNIFEQISDFIKCSFAECQENNEEAEKKKFQKALGVLLWIVGNEDGDFSDFEKDKAKNILSNYTGISEQEFNSFMKTIEKTARDRTDLFEFTRAIKKEFSPEQKIKFLDELFRMACSDGSLDYEEIEVIKKISYLLAINNVDYIKSKTRIMKECNIN